MRKKCYLDSNVLIYFKDEESDYFKKAKNIIEDLVKNGFDLFISPLVLDEVLYVFNYYLAKKYKTRSRIKKLKEILNGTLDLPNLQIINPPVDKQKQIKVVEFIDKFSLYPRDAYHLLTMMHHKIDHLASFDKDFQNLEKLEIKVIQ